MCHVKMDRKGRPLKGGEGRRSEENGEKEIGHRWKAIDGLGLGLIG